MFKKLKIKSLLLFIISLVVILIVYGRQLFNFNILTYGDWYYFYKESLSTVRLYYFHSWISDFTLGGVSIGIGQAPTWATYGFLAKFLNINYELSLRLIHIYPIVFLTPIFSYILSYKLTKNKIASLIGAIVYSFNTYFLVLQVGTLTLMGAFSFTPLIMYLFMITLEKKKIYYSTISGIILSIVVAYEPRVAYVIFFILFSYLVYYLIFFERNMKVFIYGMLVFCITGLLNFYWIVSLYSSHALVSNVVFNRGLFGNEFLNILYSITLYHPFWTGAKLTIFNIEPIIFYFWLIPILAFLGFWLNRKNKNVLFFGIVALIGIFLTKQTADPFPSVYPWLYQYFPGFNAFREASKFYGIIALCYSILIAGFIGWIWENWNSTKIKKYFVYFITIVIALIFLWNTKPLITGEIGTLFVPRYIPNDYLIVRDFILKQDEYFRTLSVPVFSRWNILTNLHPEIGLTGMVDSDWNVFIDGNVNAQKTYAQRMIDLLIIKDANNLLDVTSIKYIFVPLEDKINDDDFFMFYGKPRGYYIAELNKLSYLHRIDIGTKDVVVYENYNYRSHIYATKEKETIYKDLSPTIYDVIYGFVNPTEYTFFVKNVSNPFYLNFSESYHPDWKIRIGDFNWRDALTKKNYFLSDVNHFKNDATLSSYFLDPKSICRQFACKQNKDGSYDISGTLYFAPQSYMYLGLIISGSTMIIIFGYLGFIGFNSLKRKYERKNK